MNKRNPYYDNSANILGNHYIKTAYRQIDPASPLMKYHYHDGFEIFQVWTDSGDVLIEDKVYPMRNGYIYIVNSLDLHRTMPSPEYNYIRSKITFSPAYVRNILEPMDQLYLLDPFMNKDKKFSHNIIPDKIIQDRVDKLFEKIVEENNKRESGSSAMLNACLLEMLVIIYRWYTENKDLFPPTNAAVHNHVEKVTAFIGQHLGEDITIDDICSSLHLSKYYLCRLFKKTTGITIMQYIVGKRTAEAKRILLLSHKSISGIAQETGFNSFSVFSRTFKNVTGFTPSEYRNKFCQL